MKKIGTMKGIYLLPNLFTTASLFCGFLALVFSYNNQLDYAIWSIFIAVVMDGLDGRVARMTGTSSSFGLNYDSLSDLVSFGVVPGFIAYKLAHGSGSRIALAACAVYVICGALRLARFNIQVHGQESKGFVGLPIPGAAGMLMSTIMLFQRYQINFMPKWIPLMAFLLGLLMVSNIPYMSLKKAKLEKQKPFNSLVAMVLAVGLVIMASEYLEIVLFTMFASYTLLGVATGLRIPVWKLPGIGYYIPSPVEAAAGKVSASQVSKPGDSK
jgi:CDP-diacylglycerol--serine O-phosphatidyltransferase